MKFKNKKVWGCLINPFTREQSSHMESECQRAPIRAHIGNPGLHGVNREDLRKTLLDRKPRDRLSLVADPDLIGQAQDAQIGPPATARAAQPCNLWVPLAQRAPDTIDAFDGVTPVNIAAAAVVGTNAFTARSDHTHTIGAGVVTRAMEAADSVGWSFLGTATGATVTVGPVIWTGSWRQLMIKYWIQGYNGGTPVGRILLGTASISTTALTNSFSISEGVTAPSTGLGATAIPGCPLAVTLSNIGRGGTIMVDGISGGVKSLEIVGRNVTPAVASAPTLFRGASFFSDLGTNLLLLRAQLTVYDTLTATAASAQTFTAGTYLTVWGRNND